MKLNYSNATSSISTTRDTSTTNGKITAGSSSVTFSSIEQFDITGSDYDDTLLGGNGNDTLNGFSGNDSLSGGAGNDSFSDSTGNNILSGGTGTDTLLLNYYYLATRGISTTLDASTTSGKITAGSSSVTFSSIEQFDITGSDYDDTLLGGNGNDTLNGFSGNDSLSGGAGNDLLSATYPAGNKTLSGGTGTDTLLLNYYLRSATSGISTTLDASTTSGKITAGSSSVIFSSIEQFNIRGSEYSDTLLGGNGNDTLDVTQSEGGTGNDFLSGGDGNDYLLIDSGGIGQDAVDGGAGTDQLVVDYRYTNRGISTTLDASTTNGTITAGSNSVTFSSIEQFDITGSEYSDTLLGGNGSDTLNGDGGNDILTGLAGNDILIGAAGNDTLTGGSGNDTFTYSNYYIFISSNFGVDTIADFHKAADDTDKIALSKQTFTAITSNIGTGFSQKSDFAIVANDAAAAKSKAFIVYSQGTGNLFYNQNGALAGLGTGAEFATLTNHPLLAANDFVIQDSSLL